ncbi:MAG: TetR/AcrR family transcriptional regulator [Pseudomonadota bacterium]
MTTKVQERRTQEQRSHAMRERLIDATLTVLREDGYAGASVSRIVEKAGVSRGAYLHHFPAKDLLMQEVGTLVLRRVYRAAGEVALSADNSEDRLADLIWFMWRDVVRGGEGEVLLELFQAARTDRELAESLRPLAIRSIELFQHAASHYFRPKTDASPPVEQIIFLVQTTLRGLLLDAPLIRNERFYDRHVEALIRVVSVHLEPRDVSQPPTKIAAWDTEGQ